MPPGTVVSEMLKGYFLNDRLVRPAAVVVARAPDKAEAPAEQEAAAPDAASAQGEPTE